MQRILVLGGGFAGLWSAIGAARQLDALGVGVGAIEVLLVNQTPWHCIRVRNYESDITSARVPLRDVLDPVGVKLLVGTVDEIDISQRRVVCSIEGEKQILGYDRLVLALGSCLVRPAIPRAEQIFDVDTFEAATRLNDHIENLPNLPDVEGRYTVVIVGAGLTGIEVACEMREKIKAAIERAGKGVSSSAPRVVLVDHSPTLGSDMGASALPVIVEALSSLGVENRTGVSVKSVDSGDVVFDTGERIEAATVIWCAGMRANPLTAKLPFNRDHFGRIAVDNDLKIKGATAEFAAGDCAWLPIDGTHASVMSCQQGRPMGRFAGYNVVNDLLGKPMLPLLIDYYVTVMDLGPWGALYTEGWDRHVVATGAAAKQTKRTINRERIYPPLTGNRSEILAAAAPVVQPPPPSYQK